MHKASVLGPLLLGTGLLAVTACGSLGPTSADPTTTGSGFSTQQYFGGYNTLGGPIADPFGGYNTLAYGSSLLTLGIPSAVFGPYSYGYGWGPMSFGYLPAGGAPLANDIFGGTTFWTGRGGFDRQPASLPYGVAEENDVAFRPVGSQIWQPK